MPFAGYKDFAACVKANASKDNPKAYCATIMRAVEKADQEYDAIAAVVRTPKESIAMDLSEHSQKIFTIAKVDEAQRLVFGWASVAKDAAGNVIEDLQGDVITMDELEPAVYDFVLNSRIGTDLHPEDNEATGQLVESLVITTEKLEAMGLVSKTAPQGGWWAGFKFSPETFAKVQVGDRTMFSIKGQAERVEV